MPEDEDNEDIYSEEGRESLVDDDEISPEEEGFMQGAEGGGKGAKCRKCGKILGDDFIERKIKGEMHRFCSEECSDKYKQGKDD